MAPATERPPSQQGPEYETLDALQALRDQVEQLLSRPAYVPQGNWWDVLPKPELELGFEWREVFAVGMVNQVALYGRTASWAPMLRVSQYEDRIELSIQISGGWLVWQRALFFNEGPRG